MTFESRFVHGQPTYDAYGIKCYRVSCDGHLDDAPYYAQLRVMQAQAEDTHGVDWSRTCGFAIFHQCAQMAYLVLCWWGNDNELFTRVAVQKDGVWSSDGKYAFCVYDMEIMACERDFFVATGGDHEAYQASKFVAGQPTPAQLLVTRAEQQFGVKDASSQDVSEILDTADARLAPWQRIGEQLVLTQMFEHFDAACDFVAQVNAIAAAQNHHPTITHAFKQVRVTITSHDVGKLTQRDLAFARAVNAVLNTLSQS